MIDELQLYIPRSNDGWFYVKMMSDPETMAYNAPWFPPDGCVLTRIQGGWSCRNLGLGKHRRDSMLFYKERPMGPLSET